MPFTLNSSVEGDVGRSRTSSVFDLGQSTSSVFTLGQSVDARPSRSSFHKESGRSAPDAEAHQPHKPGRVKKKSSKKAPLAEGSKPPKSTSGRSTKEGAGDLPGAENDDPPAKRPLAFEDYVSLSDV